jgi:hypothetical protein
VAETEYQIEEAQMSPEILCKGKYHAVRWRVKYWRGRTIME